jgi:hypothetical protein
MVEALAKATELILLNRIFHASELSRNPGRTHFNVEVDEVDVVRGIIEYWRRDICLPLRLLIVWQPSDGATATLLERWDLQHAWSDCGVCSADKAGLLLNVRRLWKKLVIVLRTLYSVSVALPATRLARKAEVEHRRGTGSGSIGFAICTREADSEAWLLLNGHASSAYEPNAPLDFEYSAVAREANCIQLPPARCVFGTWMVTVSYLKAVSIAVPISDAPPRPPALMPLVSQGTGIAKASSQRSLLTSNSPSGLSLLLAGSPEPKAPWISGGIGPSPHPNEPPPFTDTSSLTESLSPLNGLVLLTPTRLCDRQTSRSAETRPTAFFQKAPLNAPFGYSPSDPHRNDMNQPLLKGGGLLYCKRPPRAPEVPHYAPAPVPGSTPPFASPVSNSPQQKTGDVSAYSPPFAALHAQSSGAMLLTKSNGPSGTNRPGLLTSNFRDVRRSSQFEMPPLSLLIPDRESSPWFSAGVIGNETTELAPLANISRRPKLHMAIDLPPFAFDPPPDASGLFHSDSTSNSAAITHTLYCDGHDRCSNKTEVLIQWSTLGCTLSALAATTPLQAPKV